MILDIEQIDPFSLPSIAVKDRKNLPEMRAVYFVVSDTRLLYIGRAVCLQKRWAQHHRIAEFGMSDHIAWLPLPSMADEELKKLEEACIRHFKPRMNQVVIPERLGLLTKEATSYRLSTEVKSLLKQESEWWGISKPSHLEVAVRRKALELGLLYKS
jgi:hypothetical protein